MDDGAENGVGVETRWQDWIASAAVVWRAHTEHHTLHHIRDAEPQ
jgi:hypothetical protein